MPGFQVNQHGLNTAHLRSYAGFTWLRHHFVMNQPFAQLDDLNIRMIEFPELPFGQTRCCPIFRHFPLHTI